MTMVLLGGMCCPNPTDRGESGMKRSLHTDGGEMPVGSTVAGANRPDQTSLAATLDARGDRAPSIERQRPQHLCLDTGYDNQPCRDIVMAAGYIAHIRFPVVRLDAYKPLGATNENIGR